MNNKVKCILLVEDCNISNFLCIGILEKMNIADKIVCLKNGAEALVFLKANMVKNKTSPEIILLDIKMPLMNGFEFLEKYIDYAYHHSQTSIIMLTTSNDIKDVSKAKEKGVHYFINKPLTKEKMEEVIEKIFSRRLISVDNKQI